MHITFPSQSLIERGREGDHLEDLGVDGKTLNWVFEETGVVGVN
jgi:hypothetical protein